MFKNRAEAAKLLAEKLDNYADKDVVVLAIPRGGIEIGSIVAKTLNAPLDIIVPRKIRSPQNSEFAIGALAGENKVYLNEKVINEQGISKEYLNREIEEQIDEVRRREKLYLKDKAKVEVDGKIVIIVDDGVATGATAIAAIMAIRPRKPNTVIFAAPVASLESRILLEKEADEVIFIETPSNFYAVGQFYEHFEQVSDEEVDKLLK